MGSFTVRAIDVNFHTHDKPAHATVKTGGKTVWFDIWAGDKQDRMVSVFADHANIAAIVHDLLANPEVKSAYLELLEENA